MADTWDLAVIGGGAAGFFGAIACAESRPGKRILILEKGHAVLGKVKVSGGGRCNLTHACFDPARLVEYYPRGGGALRGAFHRFQPQDTLEWFAQQGVSLKTEGDGRIFPASDHSETIIACLTGAAESLGIRVWTQAPVLDIQKTTGNFRLTLRNGSTLAARQVLLATGGDRTGLDLANRLGHRLAAPVPSLFTFKIQDDRLDGLAGLSVSNARLALPEYGLEQRGPVLVTHWGLSGPAVLRLSAWGARFLAEAAYQARLQVAWLADWDQGQVQGRLAQLRSQEPRRKPFASDPFEGLPRRLWQRLASRAGIGQAQTWADLSKGTLSRVAEELTRGVYLVTGKGEFKDEFVTCGGVVLDEVDFRSMQSRVCPGLYLAGETLDIDGLTGGFNLQSAWTTGYLAGRAAAEASGS
jgi:predicted Rossmann fold flavoprotein